LTQTVTFLLLLFIFSLSEKGSVMPPFILIILLAGFPALATDMYLPALPMLQHLWQLSLAEANFSLVIFFITFSLFLLIYGPLADRFGRRPVLFVGLLIFIAGSLFCAMAQSIGQLVLARFLQGCGAAAASSLCLTLSKDLYTGEQQKKVMAYIGVIVPLVPMLAPMLGSWVIEHLSWRVIFISHVILALASLFGAITLKEPEIHRTQGGISAVLRRYVVLLQNKSYRSLTLVFSITPLFFYSFLAASSSIYMHDFQLTSQQFGLLFGFNAVGLMAGSYSCAKLSSRLTSMQILNWSLAGMFIAGSVMFFWHPTSISFAASMFAISYCMGISRPLCNHMVLEQVHNDVGAASSLLTFSSFILGSIGMQMVSLLPDAKIIMIAVMALVGSVIPWLALRRMSFTATH
jgi:MFS transporter, DHA1 family, multidrug resistance protein